ncbi:flavocytochrome c [Mesosutterella sp. OilRF-GAM-744-9]|uniref:Urocanate reductase n=1 Tax=Mesosutterella porci TaxID=2915351 RepID=A0ABS9MSF5_9BURK|nr:flavocytochrome c [Mesosutterella sp. oilRF-744-WT-GAM-9]MCG5031558.1 flavocytochrome c [Mesosutterella sp. oilRF-744-WT-GAM-9]MCI6530589.1 flavocytochrome c [Mesosutterella sp.]
MQFKPVILAAAVATAALPATAAVRDGTYEARVLGHNAPINVLVTLEHGRMTDINVTHNLESPGVGQTAIDKLIPRMLAGQTTEIDAVTGATFSSLALKQGVREALKKAGAADSEFAARAVQPAAAAPIQTRSEVVVIGGGGAGLAAAVSALQNGATVTILEKMGYLGGSTNVCGGAFNASDTSFQRAMGIKDSPQKHFENTMKGGHMTNNPVLVHNLADHAKETLQWLETMGLEVNPKVGAATGALFQRSHYPNPAGGHTYIAVLEHKLHEYGPDRVKVLLETQATDLIVRDGRVVGVKARSKAGPVVATATKGVIISTGGFGANVAFRQKVNTGIWKEAKLDERIGCSNISVAAQGEGLMMAQKAGAELIGLADIQIHPNGTPGTGLMLDIKTSGRNRLFINENGDRFVNEGAARDVLSKAVFAQPHSSYWLVQNYLRYPDEHAIDLLSGRRMSDMLEQGRVKKAKDLEELSRMTGMPLDHLKASIEEYNKAVRNKGTPDKYGFVANHTDDREMTRGPWYFAKKVPTIHHTMGGIRVDVKAHALDKNGRWVKGLYAAGETTGGLHGENRLGGNAVADCMVNGRIAGRNAANAL